VGATPKPATDETRIKHRSTIYNFIICVPSVFHPWLTRLMAGNIETTDAADGRGGLTSVLRRVARNGMRGRAKVGEGPAAQPEG
jgi:hypothetical protein